MKGSDTIYISYTHVYFIAISNRVEIAKVIHKWVEMGVHEIAVLVETRATIIHSNYLPSTWSTGMLSLAAMSSTVSFPSEMIPTPLAIALAVIGWSPVTMITYIMETKSF